MKTSTKTWLMLTTLLAGPALAGPTMAEGLAEDQTPATVADVLVEGARANTQTASATGLSLSLKETPQSVTIVGQQQIRDFALTDVKDLLDQVVGVNVERVETDRTVFNSRGFDISNFQVDGIGLALGGNGLVGNLDTALFERVETVRGANAIMTGVGNPSATINYVRKRPTDDFQAYGAVSAGDYGWYRIEADVSGPLTASGDLTGRLIYANEDGDTYLDYNHVNRNVYGALLTWKATPQLTATLGYTRQDNLAEGVLWGALPLNYADGSRIDWDVSASTSAPWTYWDTHRQTAFAEAAFTLGGGWSAKGVFTWEQLEDEANLLYAYGYPDADTGLGIGGMTGVYPTNNDRYFLDLYASGPVSLFGRTHELVFGASSARSDETGYEDFSEVYPDYPAVGDIGSIDIPRPVYPGGLLQIDVEERLDRAYAAAHLNLSDRLKAVAGVSLIKLKTTGYSYGVDLARDEEAVSPYFGLLYTLTPNISLYASYTDIFDPQEEVDIDHRRLDPAQGESYEAGIKSEWFDGRLYATAAVFRSEQSGLADYAGDFTDTIGSYYVGVDTESQGFEFEVAGHITDNWTVGGGYTSLSIEDQDGNDTRTHIPTETLKLHTTYGVPSLRNVKVGAALRWQNAVSYADPYVQDYGIVTGDVIVEQDGYAILDLTAGVDVTDQVRATVNARNVTDEKYLGSLGWGQAFYGAPSSVSVSLSYTY